MRRILWSVGLGILGFGMGWYAQRFPWDILEITVSTIWAGCIGYGIGSIFDEQRIARRIIYWVMTFGFLGPLAAPFIPFPSTLARLSVGALAGGAVGGLIAVLQLWFGR
jgi:hypothetical protein